MLLQGIGSLSEYVRLLQRTQDELKELHEDVLINVTRFFRDPDVWETLKKLILPSLLEHRSGDQPVRLWIAGCSTGEEVYSIAICLLELFAGQPWEPAIQIFGTDASERSIERARLGIYPDSLASEISPERLRRFFLKTERGYQIAKRVRDLCIFARQNLCNDPPFSKLDLVSCRNVLIYMQPELQKQIILTFHYALRPNGFLLLGNTETISEWLKIFIPTDPRHNFYARTGETTGHRAAVSLRVRSPESRGASLSPVSESASAASA